MKKLLLLAITSLSLSLFSSFLVPSSFVYADPAACPDAGAKGEAIKGIGLTGNTCDESDVTNFAGAIVEIISIIAGVVAVIMILISAFKYMTSAGESSKVASAKTTLIYALVGIAVAVLAQVLINLTLSTVDCAKHPNSSGCVDTSSSGSGTSSGGGSPSGSAPSATGGSQQPTTIHKAQP